MFNDLKAAQINSSKELHGLNKLTLTNLYKLSEKKGQPRIYLYTNVYTYMSTRTI